MSNVQIFHIPQTINYCNYQYRGWNSKITTLPGLYIVTSVICQILHLPCRTIVLRGINTFIIGGVGFLASTYLLLKNLHPHANAFLLLLRWVRIALHPTIFFFHFLYYTDSLATVTVLFLYYVAVTQQIDDIQQSFVFEICLAILSIGTRQVCCFPLPYHIRMHPELFNVSD